MRSRSPADCDRSWGLRHTAFRGRPQLRAEDRGTGCQPVAEHSRRAAELCASSVDAGARPVRRDGLRRWSRSESAAATGRPRRAWRASHLHSASPVEPAERCRRPSGRQADRRFERPEQSADISIEQQLQHEHFRLGGSPHSSRPRRGLLQRSEDCPQRRSAGPDVSVELRRHEWRPIFRDAVLQEWPAAIRNLRADAARSLGRLRRAPLRHDAEQCHAEERQFAAAAERFARQLFQSSASCQVRDHARNR